jgi:MFS family permease
LVLWQPSSIHIRPRNNLSNIAKSQKIINLILVAFHAMMATFTAASIQSAFEAIAADLHVSLTRASYLTSLQIAILGGAPLFWRPLSNRFGRRPIFIISLICSLVGNIGCANSHSYATMGLCRAIVAFFISPAAAIGSAVVAETFFKKDRARYMGVWTLMVTIGVPISPFIFGFVALRVGYRWIYYVLAIVLLPNPSAYPKAPTNAQSSRPTPSNSSSTPSSAPKRATSAKASPTKARPSNKSSSPSAASTPPHCAGSTSSNP